MSAPSRPRARAGSGLPALAAVLAAGLAVPAAHGCELATQHCQPALLSLDYAGNRWRNTRGGLAVGGSYLDAAHLSLSIDGRSMWERRGLQAFADVLYTNGNEIGSRYPGDAQVMSNIDARGGWRLYQLWVDLVFGERQRSSLRVGRYDLNSEFAAIPSGSLFLNSSQAVSPELAHSRVLGPSIFPYTAAALPLRGAVGEGGDLAGGLHDAVPGDPGHPVRMVDLRIGGNEGALGVLEGGITNERVNRFAVGAWAYSARFEALKALDASGTPLHETGNRGAYALLDAPLAAFGEARPNGFVRAGVASERFNAIASSAAGGLVLSKFLPSRPDDQLGFALAHARAAGAAWRAAARSSGTELDAAETALELTWRMPVTDWLVLQPDLQYVLDPGLDHTLADAFVVGLRFDLIGSFPR